MGAKDEDTDSHSQFYHLLSLALTVKVMAFLARSC